MSVRLVAVDLDGTLVRRDRTVSPRTRAVLRDCAARDIAVVAVTARRWLAAAPLLRDLDLHAPALVVGGNAVRRPADGRVLRESRLPPALTGAVVDALLDARLQPMVAVAAGEMHLAGDARRDGPAAARYLARGGVVRTRPSTLRATAATRVLAMGGASRIHLAVRACAGLRCRLLVQESIVPLDATGERPLELHAAVHDKGTALRALCDDLAVSPAEVLAVGDALSDLPMLRFAGVGVLMGQSEVGLQRPGLVRAPGVEDDGAAWAIERFALRGDGVTVEA